MAILMAGDFRAGTAPSLFCHEGEFIAELRASLCLASWPWSIADQQARDLVAEALRLCGAKRPSWNEAQPEWVVHAGLLIERTRCVSCHKKLPEGHYKFCDAFCGNASRLRLRRGLTA